MTQKENKPKRSSLKNLRSRVTSIIPPNKDLSETELILRDKLAIDRTRLANQRTFLSYVRTGLYFIATALGIAYLGNKGIHFSWVEISLVIIGLISIFFGFINYLLMRKKILDTYSMNKAGLNQMISVREDLRSEQV